jgi:IS30 family transposase
LVIGKARSDGVPRGPGKHDLTSLVERQSRYIILIRNPDRISPAVKTGVIETPKVLPETAQLSITFDGGEDFTYDPLLCRTLNTGLSTTILHLPGSGPLWQPFQVAMSDSLT